MRQQDMKAVHRLGPRLQNPLQLVFHWMLSLLVEQAELVHRPANV